MGLGDGEKLLLVVFFFTFSKVMTFIWDSTVVVVTVQLKIYPNHIIVHLKIKHQMKTDF